MHNLCTVEDVNFQNSKERMFPEELVRQITRIYNKSGELNYGNRFHADLSNEEDKTIEDISANSLAFVGVNYLSIAGVDNDITIGSIERYAESIDNSPFKFYKDRITSMIEESASMDSVKEYLSLFLRSIPLKIIDQVVCLLNPYKLVHERT